jgi:dTDP-4-amino-4,6-dideoxygalactose transaminase
MKIPFSPPFVDDEVINEVIDSLSSGWITSGPKVEALEEEICNLTGITRSVSVNSWTSGAILVLKWYGIKEGDEVIIPAYTYSATALAVIHCGAKPVMIDITDDFTINTALIEQAITDKTKVIMPVDIAGWPADYTGIIDIVNKDSVKNIFTPTSSKQIALGRILVLSDAAHSIGAYYNGLPACHFADITIFSFHAVKNITTAEGGAICLNLPDSFDNDSEYKLMKLYTLNGQNKDAFSKTQGGGWKYDILFAGLKINMPDLCAAVGLAQIRKYETELLPARKKIANYYQDFFSQYPFFELPPLLSSNRESSYHLYALRIKNISESERDQIIDEITLTGVSVNVHFIPMPMLTLFKDLGFKIADFPASYDNYSREISLPIYPQLTNVQLDYICQAVLCSYHKVVKA